MKTVFLNLEIYDEKVLIQIASMDKNNIILFLLI